LTPSLWQKPFLLFAANNTPSEKVVRGKKKEEKRISTLGHNLDRRFPGWLRNTIGSESRVFARVSNIVGLVDSPEQHGEMVQRLDKSLLSSAS
jgi:hypothetical protein